MTTKCSWDWLAMLLLLGAGCAQKKAQAPPPAPPPPKPKQSVIVLLPDSGGKAGVVAITNSAGAQTLTEPYQAVRLERPDAVPSAPFVIDQAEVRRVFGSVLDALPAPEVAFTLYFNPDRDELAADDQAQLPAIFAAIRERRSTAISVIGHTDTTADAATNYQLGLRRAQKVAAILRANAADSSAVFSVVSHGDTDLAVKTARGVAERRNRRVEVIVR